MTNSHAFKDFFETYDCLTITGPTGVGKTGLAIALSNQWPIEIISMDSALVYQGMDIGTAKPTKLELAQVPHHLIDIRTPLQAYNAAEFATDATRLIKQVRSKNKLPVIVGGTLLYFKALFEGLNDLPQTQPHVREEINAEAAQLGWPAMHKVLKQIDPPTANRLPPSDAQRISRALEVWRISGKPMSSYFLNRTPVELNNKLISLEPKDRSWLHNRLELRFKDMVKEGLIDEVRGLKEDPNLHASLPSMRCVGYRQIWNALEENEKLTDEILTSIHNTGVAATRQLAKRQLTWLRGMSERVVIECDKENGSQIQTDLFTILKI